MRTLPKYNGPALLALDNFRNVTPRDLRAHIASTFPNLERFLRKESALPSSFSTKTFISAEVISSRIRCVFKKGSRGFIPSSQSLNSHYNAVSVIARTSMGISEMGHYDVQRNAYVIVLSSVLAFASGFVSVTSTLPEREMAGSYLRKAYGLDNPEPSSDELPVRASEGEDDNEAAEYPIPHSIWSGPHDGYVRIGGIDFRATPLMDSPTSVTNDTQSPVHPPITIPTIEQFNEMVGQMMNNTTSNDQDNPRETGGGDIEGNPSSPIAETYERTFNEQHEAVDREVHSRRRAGRLSSY